MNAFKGKSTTSLVLTPKRNFTSLYPIESKLYKLNQTLDPSLYPIKKHKKMWPQYQQQATLTVLIKNPSTNRFPNSKNYLEDFIFVQWWGKLWIWWIRGKADKPIEPNDLAQAPINTVIQRVRLKINDA